MFSASRRRPDSNDLYWVEISWLATASLDYLVLMPEAKGSLLDSHLPDIIYEASIPMKGIR